ncbi:uncharacterized protein LOC132308247 [Cornus florida]|uniref:uncharacterized protein LOC132308247 n=1 Tax=Cornus florida TaxID=4283 RepID=UPI0028A19D43|nr:uncharacterized protein LOC132308247 [Cornus florida]
MGSNRSWCTIWLVLYLFFSSSVHSYDNFAREYLDGLLRDLALNALIQHRSHTGVLQKVTLPANLSGMEVSVVRLRSRTLWSSGCNVGDFRIPPGSLPMPHVRRVVLVFQDLGNWSSYYYNAPGYTLLTSVVGFMVYTAPNSTYKDFSKLGIDTMGNALSIHFPNFTVPVATRTTCTGFNGSGTVYLSDVSSPNVCYSRSEGHFAIIAPLKKKKQKAWDLRAIRFMMMGFVGVVVVSIVGVVLVKLSKEKKIDEMERQADEDVVLETIWLGTTKMPSATVTRTHPVLED